MQRPLPMRRFALIFPYARKKRKGLASAEHALAHSLRPRRLMRLPLPNKNITRRKNEVKRCTKYFEQRAI